MENVHKRWLVLPINLFILSPQTHYSACDPKTPCFHALATLRCRHPGQVCLLCHSDGVRFRFLLLLFITHNFIHSFVRSFVRSFLRSFVRSFVRAFVRSGVRSFGRSFVRAFVRSGVRSFGRSGVRSFGRSGVRSFVCSGVRSFGRSGRGPRVVLCNTFTTCLEVFH